METSPEVGKLAEALAKAQAKFTPVPKTRTAKVVSKSGSSYTYKYADLSDVLEMVRPILSAQGLALAQPVRVERDAAGYRAVVTTVLLHTSGERLSEETAMPCGEDRAQAIGSAITYAKRYGACGMLGLATEDDDDGADADTGSRSNHGKVSEQPAVRDAVESAATERQRLIKARRAMIEQYPEITAPLTSSRKAPGKLGGKDMDGGGFDGYCIGEMTLGELDTWQTAFEEAAKRPDGASAIEQADLLAIKAEKSWRREVQAKAKGGPR